MNFYISCVILRDIKQLKIIAFSTNEKECLSRTKKKYPNYHRFIWVFNTSKFYINPDEVVRFGEWLKYLKVEEHDCKRITKDTKSAINKMLTFAKRNIS